jgi:hypothetical protein
MEKRTKGAWLLHHAQKLQATTSQDFDSISFAGKCGILLSAISSGNQTKIAESRLNALAKANQISPRTEVPTILDELERQKLISRSQGVVEVLAVTGYSVLEHTSTIFTESPHEAYEDAVIDLSELASELPLTDKKASEFISDTHQISSATAANTIQLGSGIGFFDAESISKQERLIFNGNLFRRDDARKVNAVLGSIDQSSANLLTEINTRLQAAGCLPLDTVKTMLGDELFRKLHSIGMFDVSVVGNEAGKNYFVTRPAAFSKFSNTIADDALDLAKAFVASLTYGMTISSYYRGRIQMISALMNKLIAGRTVGPATAIGSDYQALEMKGVVQVTPSHGGMFTMRLLKPEVGRLALAVIQSGDITAAGVDQLPGAKVTEYVGPEKTREVQRRESSASVKLGAKNLLNEIRTGGLSQ